jgi:hypothetical protein
MLEFQKYITSGEKLYVKGENYCQEAQLSEGCCFLST